MTLHSISRKLTSVYLPLPSCQDSSMFHLLKYSLFPIPWKERYKWKRELLLGRSLLPPQLPPEIHVLTIATFTLWVCQVVGQLLFTMWKNDPVIYLFLLEPFSTPPHSRQDGSGGGFQSPMAPWSDEHSMRRVSSVPCQADAALCCTQRPSRSLFWVSERVWSHFRGVVQQSGEQRRLPASTLCGT